MNISSNLYPGSQNPQSFPLLTFPDVPRILTIRLMHGDEQVKLALSSKKMEQYIKFTKIRKFDNCQVSIKEKDFTIHIDDGYIEGDGKIREYKETFWLTGKKMKPWFNDNSTVVENTIAVMKRLQATFPCIEIEIVFYITQPTEIKKILDALNNFVFVSLKRTKPETATVDAIMESYKKRREISIYSSEMPSDYSHPNAFKFRTIYYKDARWVRLEHLFSMTGNWNVRLGKTNFTSEDLNALFKYWTTSETRLTRVLEIELTEESNFQKRTIFEGLIVLRTIRSRKRFRLIANHKKKFVLYVWWTSRHFIICTYPPADFFPSAYRTLPSRKTDKKKLLLKREYRILEILQRKKVLEDTAGNQEEIRQLEEELALNEVYYVRGTPHIKDIE
uniref:FBA_2 domain-containing protein n=1 Tax=Caenorhabditis tropicalis TaxID=1561998 RepID=A0A1I7T3M9_9PELO